MSSPMRTQACSLPMPMLTADMHAGGADRGADEDAGKLTEQQIAGIVETILGHMPGCTSSNKTICIYIHADTSCTCRQCR